LEEIEETCHGIGGDSDIDSIDRGRRREALHGGGEEKRIRGWRRDWKIITGAIG